MKKKIIILLTAIFFIAVSITIFILTEPSTKPLYGRFTCINEDGSVSVITLGESTIFFKGLEDEVYKSLEKGAAFAMTYDYLKENDLPLDLGDDFGEIQQGFMADMDFASLYENKEMPITEMQYIESHNAYDYWIDNPLDGSSGIWFWVDLDRKEMYIGGKVFIFSK